MAKWFGRFADVPRLGYLGSPGVDRSTLPAHNTRPKVETYTFDGKRRETLVWPTRGGTTSASPVQMWETKRRKGESPMEMVLRRLHEALELPGELQHYHFALLQCYEELWKDRRNEPWVVAEIERLCLIDIQLVETYPETIVFEGKDGPMWANVPAFDRLIYLYEQNGYLHDALEIARRAARLHQGEVKVEDLTQKIARLEEEHVA
jgi:hypothetical protein